MNKEEGFINLNKDTVLSLHMNNNN